MLKSSNPAMKPFEQSQTWSDFAGPVEKPTTMTIGGTAQATGIQLGCAVGGGLVGWMAFEKGWIAAGASTVVFLGVFGLLFLGGMFMARKPAIAKVLGPIFSALYGGIAGAFSFLIALMLGPVLVENGSLIGQGSGELTREAAVAAGAGVIFQAMLLTMGVVAALLVATATGLLSVRGRVAKVVMFATGAIMITYVINMVLHLIGMSVPFLHDTGPVGIAISGVIVVVASLNVAMNFAMIQDSVKAGAPKFMEWYAGYALVSSIIWLYIEIVYLLYKIYVMVNRE